jgi:hypothetical protein
MTKKRVKSDFLEALELHYEAEIAKNLATLGLYLVKPTAVADHSNLMDDMKGLTVKLAEAKDGLKVLQDHFEKEEQDEI